MMSNSIPIRGEVWLADLGFKAKTRPVLILSTGFDDEDRVLYTIIPYTTALRGSQFEIAVDAQFLEKGAFLVQGPTTLPSTKEFLKKLGDLSDKQMELIKAGVRVWLGL